MTTSTRYPCSPYRHFFKELDWAIFGTLTWDDRRHAKKSNVNGWLCYQPRSSGSFEELRKEDFNMLLSQVRRKFSIRARNLAYYKALEHNLNDGCHYHFLIARNGIEKINPNEIAEFMNNYWEKWARPFDSRENGMGRADIRPYEQAQGMRGVEYCLKIEKDEFGQLRERIDETSDGLVRVCKRLSVL